MTDRVKEIIVLAVILIFTLVVYFGKVGGWMTGFQFSQTLSLIVVILIAISLLVILVLTLQNKPVGRRTVFLYVGIAVSLPFFMSLTQKIKISPEVQTLYDGVSSLSPGSKVLVSFDYDPPSAPELQPMAESFFRYYCGCRRIRPCCRCSWRWRFCWFSGPGMTVETLITG